MPLLSVLSLLLLICTAWSYNPPRQKRDVFSQRDCPAFLTFTNVVYLSGSTVELPCLCKPQKVQSVVWFFKTHSNKKEETRALSDHQGNRLLDSITLPQHSDLRKRFSIRLFSLLLFKVNPADSGIYICGSASRDYFYAYDVDIQRVEVIRFIPGLTTHRKSNPRVDSPQGQFRLFTKFRPWSVCDRCGVPGEQIQYGFCYIESPFLHVRYRRIDQTVLPCGSGAVPKAFGPLKVSAKLSIRRCQVSCPVHASGSSRMAALASFLGYSRSAAAAAPMPVYFLKHPSDELLTLGCPGARSNMVVAWDSELGPLYRSAYMIPNARIMINTGQHLEFNPAQIQDTGSYFCWLQGRRAAEIRLLVYPHLGSRSSILSHPEFIPAFKTLLMSFAGMTAAFCLLLFVQVALRQCCDS